MFELVGLSTFLDIFQKAFGLIEKRKDQKRQLFKEIIEPVYAELSVVVGEYYEFFRGCRDEFSEAEMQNWGIILDKRRKKREEIVMARNRVLGLTSPFLAKADRKGQDISPFLMQVSRKGKEDELLYLFAEEIQQFFYTSDDLQGRTLATSLFDYIDAQVAGGNEESKPVVIKEIENVLQLLEYSWNRISIVYGQLRVCCLR